MKKIQPGAIEILGYIGLTLWLAILFLRQLPPFENAACRLWLGILPNLGAAWAMTMLARWGIMLGLKKTVTQKTYLCICVSILILALISEIIHAVWLNSPFDINDILITIFAQITIFTIPLLLPGPYWGKSGQ